MMFWPWSSSSMWDMMGAFGGFTFAAFGLLFAFWLWMMIDLLQRRKFEDKLVWVLVLVFLNIIGAALYYFLVKCCRGKK